MARRLTRQLALAVTVLLAATGLVSGCATSSTDPAEEAMVPTDYIDPDNWLARPATPTRPVATFYLYPTSAFGATPAVAADDPAMRANAAQVFAVQGAAYAATDVYAPYYRQISLSTLLSTLDDPVRLDSELARVPLVDALAAFEYFLDHDAGDRPFILAAHSQGAMVIQGLLRWIAVERPELRERIVAAYLVGIPVTADFLDEVGIPFATSATDTGVAISWNTESADATVNPFLSMPPGLVINPVSWRRDDAPASRDESLGGLVRFDVGQPATPSPHFASARLDLARGTVVTDAPLEARDPWPVGVLHRWDYDLFLYDIEHNVTDRIAAYLG